MKTVQMALVVCASTVAASVGAQHRESAGLRMFGEDGRWNTAGEFGGTLARKHPSNFKVGDWGCTQYPFEVVTTVSDTECLVRWTPPRWKPHAKVVELLIRGWDTSKASPRVRFRFRHPVVISGVHTFTHRAIFGDRKVTALVLERNEDKLKELVETARKATEAARAAAEEPRKAAVYRNWTDSTGEFVVKAKFIEFRNGRAHLQRSDDGRIIAVSMSRLSKESQEWIREHLKQQREGD